MALLRETYYIYRRNLRIWIRTPALFVPPLFISGLLFVLFGATFEQVTSLGGFGTGDYQAFLVAWILVQAVVFSGGDSGFALMTDIVSGYFDKLLLAPIHRFSILGGNLLVAGTRALLQGVVILIIAVVMGVSFKAGLLGVLALLAFGVAFGIGWACLGVMIALQTKSVQATQSSFVFFFPFIFLTTAFMPEEMLSGWLKVAVKINPVTYVLEAMRAFVVEGWEWGTIVAGLWVLGAMTVIPLLVTTWLYRRATA